MNDHYDKTQMLDAARYAEKKKTEARNATKNEDWSESETMYGIVLQYLPNDLEANLFCRFAKLNRFLYEQRSIIEMINELKECIDKIPSYYNSNEISRDNEVLDRFGNCLKGLLDKLSDCRSDICQLAGLTEGTSSDKWPSRPNLLDLLTDLYEHFRKVFLDFDAKTHYLKIPESTKTDDQIRHQSSDL